MSSPRVTAPPSFRAGVAWTLGSAGVSYVATFASAPLLLAVYSPTTFGGFALWSTLAVLAGNISSLRYERAVVYEPDAGNAWRIFAGCIGLNLAIAAGMLALMLGVTHGPMPRLGTEHSVLALAAALTAFTGIAQTTAHWLTRSSDFKRLGHAEMCGALVTVVLQLGLGLAAAPTIESLLGGVVAGRAATVLISAAGAGATAPAGSSAAAATLIGLAKRYRDLAFYATPYALVSLLQFRSLLFVAAYFGGAAAAGQLMLAYRLTSVPATAIGAALRRVFFPVFSRGFAEPATRARALATLAYLGVAVPPLAVGCALALPWAAYLLPAEWQGAVGYIYALAPLAAAVVFTSWFDRVFDILNRQRSALAMETLSSTAAIGAAVGLAAAGWSLPAAIWAYSILLAVYNLVWLGFTWRLINWPPGQYLRAVAAGAAYTAALCAAFLANHAAPWITAAYVAALALGAWRRRAALARWLDVPFSHAHQELA